MLQMDSQTIEGGAADLVDLEGDNENVEGDDGSPNNKRFRTTTSDCWKYFTKLGPGTDGVDRAKCDGCGNVFRAGGHSHGTTSLNHHKRKCPKIKHADIGQVMIDMQVNLRNQKREIVLGCAPKFVYTRQRKKIKTMIDVIEIDPEVDFANQEGDIDSRYGTKIAYAHHKNKTETVNNAIESVSSIFPFDLKSIPRRPRTKIMRKLKGNVALSRSKKKLNSGVFDNYLAKIWRNFSEGRKRSFAYLDSLWFSLYRNASCKDKVLSWIKKEHIFTKEYVFVPIVCWGHWSLLIFCHFGENLQSFSGSRCMLLLDSLEMADPRRLEPDIRRFVQDIYKTGDRPETKSLISQIPLLVPKVPQQKDDTDCGNFVLYFIKLFFELAPDNFSMEGYPYFMKKDWFTFEELDSFCENLIR